MAQAASVHQPPSHAVRIHAAPVMLDGDLTIPDDAVGLVVFAHGSGSGRHSPRNRAVASWLNDRGLATLLLDLLTPTEERVDLETRALRFDIPLLGERLVAAVDWAAGDARTAHLPVGTFGASTGAAAALIAAAERPARVAAVVSRGGRPDLAGAALAGVACPTLMIVGGEDRPVIALNKEAIAAMTAPTKLVIIPGATHLFEEPGALDEVCRLAGDWLAAHLARAGGRADAHPTHRKEHR